MALLDLTDEQKKKLTEAFNARFKGFQKLRQPLDTLIKKYQRIYNFDFTDKKADYKQFIPYTFTIIQTILAFLVASMFGRDKMITMDIEGGKCIHMAKNIELYVNSLLEKVKLKRFSYDFLLNSLTDNISWIQLIPIKEDSHFTVDIDSLNFFDVYFDTKAKRVEDIDPIVRTLKGYLDLSYDEHYYKDEVEKIKDTKPPSDVIDLENQTYKFRSEATYYHPEVVNNNDLVEVLTWNTRYDIDDNGELEDIILAFGNRKELIRAELNNMKTRRKTLLFPIVALRESNALLGKSLISPIADLQDLLNESMDLRQRHFRLLVKLLFKYNKNADVDFTELHASGGNAVGYDGDPNDVSIFTINNMLGECNSVTASIIQLMQQVTGATDYMMGTTLGRGITETARGVSIITQNAMQKFNLLVNNITPYVIDIIKYIIILFNQGAGNSERVKFFKVQKFVKLSELDIEEDFKFDIALKNLAADIDRERAQFINAVNVMGQMIMAAGGDIQAVVKLALEKFGLKSRELAEVFGETPEQKKKLKAQQKAMGVLSKFFGGKAGGIAAPQARQTESAPEETSETGGGM